MNLTYKDAGVDIDAGNKLVDCIKPLTAKTHRTGMISSIGGFGGLFELPLEHYKNPVLVSSTDGVGTKLKFAIAMNKHDTIGIDLVAMCVNDVIVQGAEPLFFLDYFATGKLDVGQATSIISGIAAGCEEANVALIGGETAEMPGLYATEDYDLAGFVVGIVEKSKMITGTTVSPGDKLIALPSSGLHSNGYSLARKVLAVHQHPLEQSFGNSTLGNALLTPTRIYVKTILRLLQQVPLKALAHITGGGLIENVPRVLPPHTHALLKRTSWEFPAIFSWLQNEGGIEEHEMLRTFNCGVGMVICVAPEDATPAIQALQKMGEQAWEIGSIVSSQHLEPSVSITS